MGEVRVGRDTKNSGVDSAEARKGVVVLDDLGRADEGEVHGVEKEDNPISNSQLDMPQNSCERGRNEDEG